MRGTRGGSILEFSGGQSGPWCVAGQTAIAGLPLANIERLDVRPVSLETPRASGWSLRGVTSHERYVAAEERAALVAQQAGLGRAEARCAALIPIRKNPA